MIGWLMGMREGKARLRWSFNASLGVLVLALGVAQLLVIPIQIAEPPRFSGFVTIELGPKALPKIVAWMFVILGALYTFMGLSLRETHGLASISRSVAIDVAIVIAVMIGFALALRPLGFVVSAGLSGLMIALFLGSRNLFGLAFVGLLAPVAIYLLFTRALSVSLPSSPYLPGL